MTTSAGAILEWLSMVEAERARRSRDAGLDARVQAVKAYQQRRFELTYADLLVDPRYAPASRFFLEELYGPADFSQRDNQFARVVPSVVRMFPGDVVDVIGHLAHLHALSEGLDTAMALNLDGGGRELGRDVYAKAWLATGREADRARQIELTLKIARSLGTLTRSALIRNSLRLMRAPARAAGLTQLQHFLEAGFDAFRAMGDIDTFVAAIESRERLLVRALFSFTDAHAGASRSDLTLLLPEAVRT